MPGRRLVPGTWVSYPEAVRLFVSGATLRTATPIALVVGTWLTALNQGHLVAEGEVPWSKVALNYLTPFLVASVGFLAARRRRNVERLAALLDGTTERPEGG